MILTRACQYNIRQHIFEKCQFLSNYWTKSLKISELSFLSILHTLTEELWMYWENIGCRHETSYNSSYYWCEKVKKKQTNKSSKCETWTYSLGLKYTLCSFLNKGYSPNQLELRIVVTLPTAEPMAARVLHVGEHSWKINRIRFSRSLVINKSIKRGWMRDGWTRGGKSQEGTKGKWVKRRAHI